MSAEQILQITLMGAAIDFANALQAGDIALMKAIRESIIATCSAAPGFLTEVKRLQKIAFAQIRQDIESMSQGGDPVTPKEGSHGA